MTSKNDFGPLFYLHLALILFTYLSPFLFNFYIILGGVVLLQLQYMVFGGCVLTHAELGNAKYQTFYYHYLSKYFPQLQPKSVWIFSTYILSALGIILSLVLKIFLFQPLIY